MVILCRFRLQCARFFVFVFLYNLQLSPLHHAPSPLRPSYQTPRSLCSPTTRPAYNLTITTHFRIFLCYALPPIISASNLSSSPFPSPSLSHSPPSSSNKIGSSGPSFILANSPTTPLCTDDAADAVCECEKLGCASPVTLGICGGGSDTKADEVSEDKGSVEAGVEESRSV